MLSTWLSIELIVKLEGDELLLAGILCLFQLARGYRAVTKLPHSDIDDEMSHEVETNVLCEGQTIVFTTTSYTYTRDTKISTAIMVSPSVAIQLIDCANQTRSNAEVGGEDAYLASFFVFRITRTSQRTEVVTIA